MGCAVGCNVVGVAVGNGVGSMVGVEDKALYPKITLYLVVSLFKPVRDPILQPPS